MTTSEPTPGSRLTYVNVTLFKPSGKYYTREPWLIPPDAIGPHDMGGSPNFRRIDGGAVLVESQEPWGFPHLFPSGWQHRPMETYLTGSEPCRVYADGRHRCECRKRAGHD